MVKKRTMNNKLVLIVFFSALIALPGCKKEGCTDFNADNYDGNADKNSGCVYRYASTIDVAGVAFTNPAGGTWDIDESGPDLRVDFGKSSSSGFDFTTDTRTNASSASLTPTSNIQFTNEDWKYEVVDDDLLGASEIIASGTFNPLQQGSSNMISIMNGSVSIKFNYSVK
jgi:hypothetical protein